MKGTERIEVMTMMWWGSDDMGGWGYALMGLSPLVLWGVVITAIVLAARHVSRATGAGSVSRPPMAEELLAQRNARGEIDTDTAPGWIPCADGTTTRLAADRRTPVERR